MNAVNRTISMLTLSLLCLSLQAQQASLPEKAQLPSTTQGWKTLASPELAANDYVLIVGNAAYASVEPLPSALTDIAAMESFMMKGRRVPPQQVKKKPNLDAGELRKSVEDAARNAPAGGTLWFYYSGHGGYGLLSEQTDPLDNGAQRVLLGRRTQPETWRDDAVPLSWIERTLLSSKAEHVVLILDACYSKILPKGQRASFPRDEPDEPARVVVWSAVERDQEAATYSPPNQGLFTYLALAALTGAADGTLEEPDGKVTLEEAQAWTSQQLNPLCVTQQTITLGLKEGARATWPVVDNVVPGWRDFSNLPPAFPTCKQIAETKSAVDNLDSGSLLAPAKPKLEWISLPGGTFKMGNPDAKEGDWYPAHSVKVSPFKMSETEVTVAQYRACVDAGGCTKPRDKSNNKYCNWGYADRDNHPINCVDWNQAKAFAKWVGGRLPTEAEFEYAARSGGMLQRYPWGNSDPTCDRAIFYYYRTGGCGESRTWDVCSKTKGNTEQGLCDMAGNVREWTSDRYDAAYYKSSPSSNPSGPSSGSSRVVRGGGWTSQDGWLMSAVRDWVDPGDGSVDLGFRVVVSSSRVGSP